MPSSDGCQSGGNRLAHAALCSAALILGCEGRDGAGDFGTMGGDPILMTFVWPPSGEQTAAMATASDPVFIGLMKVRTDYRDGEYQEFIAGRRAAAASSVRHSSASTDDGGTLVLESANYSTKRSSVPRCSGNFQFCMK
jgi:hypothetical protein